jgi:hypothetical protein
MQRWLRLSVLSFALGSATAPALGAEPAAEPPGTAGAATLKTAWDLLGPSRDMAAGLTQAAEAARELRLAAEAAESLAATAERVIAQCADAAVQTSANLAAMSAGFDPLGYKAAFATIQRQTELLAQQQTLIQQLQEAEAKRLRGELQRLRRQLRDRPRR